MRSSLIGNINFYRLRYSFFCFMLDSAKFVLEIILEIIRTLIFAASTFVLYFLGIFFPFGVYSLINAVIEMQSGLNFSETTNYGFVVLFFITPLVAGFIRQLVK